MQYKNIKEITVIADKGWYKTQVEQWLPLCEHFKIRVINLDSAPEKDANALGKKYIEALENHTNYLTFADIIQLI
jgi:hypothetical protein